MVQRMLPGWGLGQAQLLWLPLQSHLCVPSRTITPWPACLYSGTRSPSPRRPRTSTRTTCSSCISSPTCITSGPRANTRLKGKCSPAQGACGGRMPFRALALVTPQPLECIKNSRQAGSVSPWVHGSQTGFLRSNLEAPFTLLSFTWVLGVHRSLKVSSIKRQIINQRSVTRWLCK